MRESLFDLVVSLRDGSLTRRRVIQGSAAALLAGVTSFARASPPRKQSTAKSATEGTPYSPALHPSGIRSRFVHNVNGHRMHVLEAGFEVKGWPGVVLLHGFPELAYSWRKVMLPLAGAGFHVIAPDRRGYGRTSGWDVRYDDDAAPFATLNQVRDVLGLVSAFGYRSVTLKSAITPSFMGLNGRYLSFRRAC